MTAGGHNTCHDCRRCCLCRGGSGGGARADSGSEGNGIDEGCVVAEGGSIGESGRESGSRK